MNRMSDHELEKLRRWKEFGVISPSDTEPLFSEIDRLRLIESRLNSAPFARKARSKRKEAK
jgi:hypothetical protein